MLTNGGTDMVVLMVGQILCNNYHKQVINQFWHQTTCEIYSNCKIQRSIQCWTVTAKFRNNIATAISITQDV